MAPALCFALWDRASRLRAEAIACMFLYGANKPHSPVYLFYQSCKSTVELNFVNRTPHLAVPSSANKDHSADVSARVAINRDRLTSPTAIE